MSETRESPLIKRHGLIGKTIEYETELSLKEVEDRLHQAFDRNEPSQNRRRILKSVSYPHPTQLVCEIVASFTLRDSTLSTAKANGEMTRETDSKRTRVVFDVTLASDFWWFIGLTPTLIFLIAFLRYPESASNISFYIATSLIIIIIAKFINFDGEYKYLLDITKEIFL